MFNRRSAIAALGLGSAASGASVIEALGSASVPQEDPFITTNPSKDTMVKALRALADEIDGDSAYILESSLLTELKPDELIVHKFSISFSLKPEKA